MSDERPSPAISVALEGDVAARINAALGRARERAATIGTEAPSLREVIAWLLSKGLAIEERVGGMPTDERRLGDLTGQEFAKLFGLDAASAARHASAAAQSQAEAAARTSAEALKVARTLFEDARALVGHSGVMRLRSDDEIAIFGRQLHAQLEGAGPGHVLLVVAGLVDEVRRPFVPSRGSRAVN